jgi:hypothetical protein
MRNVDNNDILAVYSNIWWASYNHMRWFLKALDNNWFTTGIDYSDYLTEEEANSKWWALKTKLSKILEDEWVDLPEMASLKVISEKSWEKKWNWKNQNNWKNTWFFANLFSGFAFWR